MAALLEGLLIVWRNSIGLIIPDSCRFTPSCSHYAVEALQRRGLVAGAVLTVWRLLRCNPWSRGGHDPVIASRPPCRTA